MHGVSRHVARSNRAWQTPGLSRKFENVAVQHKRKIVNEALVSRNILQCSIHWKPLPRIQGL